LVGSKRQPSSPLHVWYAAPSMIPWPSCALVAVVEPPRTVLSAAISFSKSPRAPSFSTRHLAMLSPTLAVDATEQVYLCVPATQQLVSAVGLESEEVTMHVPL
jgi:hypothetical protein